MSKSIHKQKDATWTLPPMGNFLDHSDNEWCFTYLWETQMEVGCNLAIAKGHSGHLSLERHSLRDTLTSVSRHPLSTICKLIQASRKQHANALELPEESSSGSEDWVLGFWNSYVNSWELI